MTRLGFLQLLCAFKQLRFVSFYLTLSSSIIFLWFSQAHAVVLRLAAVMWRCIHSYVYSHYSHWNLHILAFIGETIGVRTNKKRMSCLGFSNEPFRVFATVVFLQTTQVFFLLPFTICIYFFSSFHLSLSASITSLSFTFPYLHLLFGFFLLHLLLLFLLPFFICIYFMVFSLLHLLLIFLLPFFICIYFMAFFLLLEP